MVKKNKKASKTTTTAASAEQPAETSTTNTTTTTTTPAAAPAAKPTSSSTTKAPTSKPTPEEATVSTSSSNQSLLEADAQDDQVEEQEQEKGLRGKANKEMNNMNAGAFQDDANTVDEGKLNRAMTFISDVSKTQREQKTAREKELEKVTISKEDVELIMKEMNLGKAQAEKVLRENKGHVVDALRMLISV
ncbi:hypothetical protein HK102_006383 [Quaeritorhiza haematococci]|nr:hypothetical protein HK102_006383 [Quaeritorhiza haematococci]